MRFAAMAVGAAVIGAAGVLLSVAPAPPPAPGPVVAPAEAAGAGGIRAASCPPCDRGPMGPIGWLQAIARSDQGEALDRAAALSLAADRPEIVRGALEAEDHALRELAALLLNVASGRVAGCTPLDDGGHVAVVLDRLDRLLAAVRQGEAVAADELAAAAAAARIVNRGEGLPPDCRG